MPVAAAAISPRSSGANNAEHFRGDLEHRRGVQEQRAFDQVFQLAHVARPGVVRELDERVRIDAIHPAAGARRVFLREELHQQRDVFGARAQRRQLDRETR